MKKYLLLLTLLLLHTSCASIVDGKNQPVSVETISQHGPVNGAHCSLQNDKGKWFIPSTPGSAVVNRAYGDLIIHCTRDEMRGNESVKSSTKGMAFGNILIGGGIGAGIDCVTGAAYDYPTNIVVKIG